MELIKSGWHKGGEGSESPWLQCECSLKVPRVCVSCDGLETCPGCISCLLPCWDRLQHLPVTLILNNWCLTENGWTPKGTKMAISRLWTTVRALPKKRSVIFTVLGTSGHFWHHIKFYILSNPSDTRVWSAGCAVVHFYKWCLCYGGTSSPAAGFHGVNADVLVR